MKLTDFCYDIDVKKVSIGNWISRHVCFLTVTMLTRDSEMQNSNNNDKTLPCRLHVNFVRMWLNWGNGLLE